MQGCPGGWGACMVAGGSVVAGGACVVAGGACVVAGGGHAWLPGACVVAGGMHGCRGACVGYEEIRSMSGRYASCWNAFLF